MFSYLYMKILESSPERYDRGISMASLGAADRSRERMVKDLGPEDRVAESSRPWPRRGWTPGR
ncbi:MAG: hypothetical protein ABIM40_10020 [Pseudomonadota bacterium]